MHHMIGQTGGCVTCLSGCLPFLGDSWADAPHRGCSWGGGLLCPKSIAMLPQVQLCAVNWADGLGGWAGQMVWVDGLGGWVDGLGRLYFWVVVPSTWADGQTLGQTGGWEDGGQTLFLGGCAKYMGRWADALGGHLGGREDVSRVWADASCYWADGQYFWGAFCPSTYMYRWGGCLGGHGRM